MTKKDLKLLNKHGIINNYEYTHIINLFNQVDCLKNLIEMTTYKYNDQLKELKEKENIDE